MRRPLPLNHRAVLVTALAALALTACDGTGTTGHGAHAGHSVTPPRHLPSTARTTSRPTPTPTPTRTGPTLPPAADGKDIKACYDGSCEVEVRAPLDIPMAPRTGVAKLTVESVDAQGVRITGRMTNGNSMEVTVFADPGSLAYSTVDSRVEIASLGVVNGLAVIRISPVA